MADFVDYPTATSHAHPRKKRLLGIGKLEHSNVDRSPSLNQLSTTPKSPQSSRESPGYVDRSTLSSNYSLLETKDCPRQEQHDFSSSEDPAPPLLNHRYHSSNSFSSTPFSSSMTMASHGRPKLKRETREPDMSNATPSRHPRQIVASSASPITDNLSRSSTVTSHVPRLRPMLKRGSQGSSQQNASRSSPPMSNLRQCSSSPSSLTSNSPNRHGLSSSNNSRDKSPVDGRIEDPSSSLTYTEAAGGKSPPNDDRASPDPNCAICLGKLRNKSFTDSCLHQFCFKCLVQWSKVKPECPLCKQGFKSIIHNVRSNEDYDQYHCRPAQPSRCRESLIDELIELNSGLTRFRYRTTMTDHRMTVSGLFRDLLSHSYVIPSASPQRWPSRTARRQLASAEFRTSIYNRDLWVEDLPDFTGRFRECSPEFYSANQAQLHRLVPWLNREIPCVVSNSSIPPTVIIELIFALIIRFTIQSPTMYGQLRPYFGVRTRHFMHEFHAFARSPFDLIGFDQSARYGPNPNPTIYTADDSDASNDSDVICLETDEAPVAGPSGLNRPGGLCISVTNNLSFSGSIEVNGSTRHVAETVLDDSDDCEIVDYIKPRHERTPEVVLLSDSEHETTTLAPSFSGSLDRWFEAFDGFNQILSDNALSPQPPSHQSPSPQTPSPEPTSDSDFVPYSPRQRRNKSVKKKCSRKRSSSSQSKRNVLNLREVLKSSTSESCDSDRYLSSWVKKKARTKDGPNKVSNRKRSRRLSTPSPQAALDLTEGSPGTSGFPFRQFGSDNSQAEHSTVVIPHLDGSSLFSSHWSSLGSQERPVRTPPTDPIPAAAGSRRWAQSYGRRREAGTWRIKPSGAELSDDEEATPSSPENPPRLKSIVIVRNPHEHSRSPIPSTSGIPPRNADDSSSSWRHPRSPSSHDNSSRTSPHSSPRGKTSKRKHKSKCGKKVSTKRSRKRSESLPVVLKSKRCKLPSWYRPMDSDTSSS